MSAGAVIVDARGRALLIRENYGRRRWGLPGGSLEPDELPSEAVIREVREELGIEVEVIGVLSVIEWFGRERHLGYGLLCRILTGVPYPADAAEIADVGWFPPDGVPRPIRKSAELALKDLQAGRLGLFRRRRNLAFRSGA